MRLAELNPEFLDSSGGVRGVGIGFDCPCGDAAENHRCYVPFAIALDGTVSPKGWQRTGESFETLTLWPSILRRIGGCGWHGFITSGAVVAVQGSGPEVAPNRKAEAMATYQAKSGATLEAYVVTEQEQTLQVQLGAGIVTLKAGDALITRSGKNYSIDGSLFSELFEAAPEPPPAEEPPPEPPPAEEPPPPDVPPVHPPQP